jgi:hypothetical protein
VGNCPSEATPPNLSRLTQIQEAVAVSGTPFLLSFFGKTKRVGQARQEMKEGMDHKGPPWQGAKGGQTTKRNPEADAPRSPTPNAKDTKEKTRRASGNRTTALAHTPGDSPGAVTTSYLRARMSASRGCHGRQQHTVDLDECWAEQHQKQRREDEEDQREEQLQRDLGGLFFGTHAALGTQHV